MPSKNEKVNGGNICIYWSGGSRKSEGNISSGMTYGSLNSSFKAFGGRNVENLNNSYVCSPHGSLQVTVVKLLLTLLRVDTIETIRSSL